MAEGHAIEITPEMVEVGKTMLMAKLGSDRWLGGDEEIVTAIFCAMMNELLAIEADGPLSTLLKIHRDHPPS